MGVIYKVTCVDCMEELEFTVSLDADNDLNVYAEPCAQCLAAAREEGVVEGKDA